MNIVRHFLLLISILVLAGCASQSLLEKYRDQSDKEIFAGGEAALVDGDWTKASEHFEALQALYPFGPYAQQGQLDIIYSYYADGEYASAEAAAQRYIHLYPLGPHTDYAYYMKGLSEFVEGISFFQRHFSITASDRDLAPYEKAFASFDILIQRYPNSEYSADAHKRLIYLRNVFAGHYLNVATYYFSRKAYVAAAENAAIVVKNYQRTDSVPDALVMMVQAYRKLNLPDQANDALKILKLNYPDKVSELDD